MVNQLISDYDLYERQLNSVEDLLSVHPEFLDVLTPDEQQAFKHYFTPDWETVVDFRAYHDELLRADPDAGQKAHALLHKFLDAHKIDLVYLLGQNGS